MSRLPAVDREALGPEDRAIWDRIAAGRGGAIRGPSAILMHVPALAGRVAAVQDYFGSQAELAPPDRELVILAAVREMGARFAWARHEPRAHEVGVRTEAIETVRALGPLDGLTQRERLLVDLVRALVRTHALSDELFSRALAELGRTELVETVTLVGHYSLVGLIINGFDVPPMADGPTF